MQRSLWQSIRAALALAALLAASLLATETLHLSRRNPFFVADLSTAVWHAIGYYALFAVVVGSVAGVSIRSARARAFTIAAIGYAVISLKMFWLDAGLLASPRIAVAFVAFSCGWFVAAIYAARRLDLPHTFPILLTVAYANVCLGIQSGWALGGGRLFAFLSSPRTILIGLAGVAGIIGVTALQRSLERRRAWWPALVPSGVLLVLLAGSAVAMRRLPHNHGTVDSASDPGQPDIFIMSFDALRSDMLQAFVAEHPDSNLAWITHRATTFDNVVSHGTSTDRILANNTFAGASWTDCPRSIPGQLAARGYFTAMLYGALGKRFEGSDCYEYYFSGSGDALLRRYSVTALADALGDDSRALRHGALHARDLLDEIRELATVPTALYTYVHFLELHAPYVPEARRHDREFEAAMREFMRRCYTVACDPNDPADAKLVALARAAYVSLLEEADRAVGEVLAIAKQRGRPYLLVVTADHGELLGEHGGFAHSGGFVPELLDVPFVVMDSRDAAPAQRCELMMSSEAVRSTALDATDLDRAVYPDRDVLRFELPPLGRAEIAKQTSTIRYEIASEMMPHAGTWRNIHHEREGSMSYPLGHCDVATRPTASAPERSAPPNLQDPSSRHL